jgi:hypothetical protein
VQDKTRKSFVPREAAFWEPQLHAIRRVTNGDRVLRKIATAGDKESVRDLLAEVRFALVLIGCGFDVAAEPRGAAGPDLEIAHGGQSLLLEVTRLRLNHEMPVMDPTSPAPMLAELGDPEPDVRRAYGKIVGKLRQLDHQPGAIAIWNDDEVLDDLHCRTAVHRLQTDLRLGRVTSASETEIVLYLSHWIASDRSDLYAWTVQCNPAPWVLGWANRLDRQNSRAALELALAALADCCDVHLAD